MYNKTTYIERVLVAGPDGSLGVADILNRFTAGGLGILEWRIVRIVDDKWLFVARVGEKAQKSKDKQEAVR